MTAPARHRFDNRRSRPTPAYGYEHVKWRRVNLPYWLGKPCPAQVSPRCDRIMREPRRMHADHHPPRALAPGTLPNRFVCMPCNLTLGAQLGARIGNARRRARRRQSREW